jgi:hypothetical protein
MTEAPKEDAPGAAVLLGISAMIFAALLFALAMVRARASVGTTFQGDALLGWSARLAVVIAAALRWFDLRLLAAASGATFLALVGLRGWQIASAGFHPTDSSAAAVLSIVLGLYALHLAVAAVGLFSRRIGWRLLWVFLAVVWVVIDGTAFVW